MVIMSETRQRFIKFLLWKSFEARAIAKWKSTWRPNQLWWVEASQTHSISFYVSTPLTEESNGTELVASLKVWILLKRSTGLKQSGSMIIHSFNQTCLVVKMLHYYSCEMKKKTRKRKSSEGDAFFFVQTLQSNRFMFFFFFFANQKHPFPLKNRN